MENETNAQDALRRKLMLAGAGAAIVGGWACGSAARTPEQELARRNADEAYEQNYKNHQEIMRSSPIRLTDEIFGWGVMENDRPEEGGWDSCTFALLGKKNTYLIYYFAKLRQCKRTIQYKLFRGKYEGMYTKDGNLWGMIKQSFADIPEFHGRILPAAEVNVSTFKTKAMPFDVVLRDPPPDIYLPKEGNLHKSIKRVTGKLITREMGVSLTYNWDEDEFPLFLLRLLR